MSQNEFFAPSDVDQVRQNLINAANGLSGEQKKLFDILMAAAAREVLDSQGVESIEPILEDVNQSAELAVKRFRSANNLVEYDDASLATWRPPRREVT
jgi:hypothetical protein